MSDINVYKIDLESGLIYTDDGSTHKILKYMDDSGDPVDNIEETTRITAEMKFGDNVQYIMFANKAFEPPTIH